MRMRESIFKVIIKLLVVIIVLVIVGTVAYVALQVSGRNRLYQKSSAMAPNLSQIRQDGNQTAQESTAEVIVTQPDVEEEDNWQEGDVRYKGIHYRYNQETLTFLFLGIDKMGEVKPVKNGIDGGQSDAIFLLVLNPKSKEASVIGIPRDTMTDIAIYDKEGNYVANATGQLTLQHGYGDGAQQSCERSLEAVSKLFYDLPIHGYCAINMGAIPLINDAVGGVEVTALENVINTNIKEGQNILLKGKDAYSYLHNRDTNSEGSALRRQERQKQYITAYAETALAAMKEDITLPVTLYNTISKYMVTDITIDEVSYLASQAAGYHFPAENMHTLEGVNFQGNKFEEFYVNETALYELILEVFYEEVE